MTPLKFKRRFADVGTLQVHYREGGSGDATPLVMIHASPGASRQVAPLAALLANGRRVVAPDTAGNGDSDALPDLTPAIPDLAAHARAAIDKIVDGKIDLYGSHTGASIAMEIAQVIVAWRQLQAPHLLAIDQNFDR